MRKIFIVREEWVFTGIVVKTTKNYVYVHNCQCIEYWGTDKGLSQIAITGFVEGETRLSVSCTMRLSKAQIIAEISCLWE